MRRDLKIEIAGLELQLKNLYIQAKIVENKLLLKKQRFSEIIKKNLESQVEDSEET